MVYPSGIAGDATYIVVLLRWPAQRRHEPYSGLDTEQGRTFGTTCWNYFGKERGKRQNTRGLTKGVKEGKPKVVGLAHSSEEALETEGSEGAG